MSSGREPAEILDEELAYSELDEQFSSGPFRSQNALEILLKFPALASRKFPRDLRYLGLIWYHPLWFFLFLGEGDPSLEEIRKIYELFPKALEESRNGVAGCSPLPLHRACARPDISLEIVMFIAQAYPEAAAVRDDLGMLPVSCVDKGSDSFALLQMLIEINPDCIKREDTFEILKVAAKHDFQLHEIQYLLDRLPKPTCPKVFVGPDFGLDIYWGSRTMELTKERAEALTLMLPDDVSELVLAPAQWSLDGFKYMIQFLAGHHRNIVKLDLKIPVDMLYSDAHAQAQVIALIQDNTSINILTLNLENIREGDSNNWVLVPDPNAGGGTCRISFRRARNEVRDDGQFLSAVTLAVTERTKLYDNLILKGFRIDDFGILKRFFACRHCPQSLCLDDFKIFDTGNSTDSLSFDECLVERFLVFGLRTSHQAYCHFMALVAELPFLSEFRLSDHFINGDFQLTNTDITLPVVSLLQSPTLVSLSLCWFQVDIEQIESVLSSNRCLRNLDIGIGACDPFDLYALLQRVLQEHNYTLNNISIGTYRDEVVEYYLTLNESGRTTRDPSTTREAFVRLLADTLTTVKDSLNIFNIQYGLLREQPSLWS